MANVRSSEYLPYAGSHPYLLHPKFFLMFGVFGDSAALVFLNQCAWFGVARMRRDNTYADMGWGTGFILVAANAMRLHPTPMTKLLFAMSLIWGARLSTHLFIRHQKEGKEDWRYTALRKRWSGSEAVNSFVWVFMMQGFFMYVISLIFQWASVGRVSLSPTFALIGGAIFAAGVAFETIADVQLLRFKNVAANKDRTFTGGLWGASRHPNYFGEILTWWGMFIATLPTPTVLFTFLSPLTITALILKVSGVNMMERKLGKRADYKEYQRALPAVVPNLRKLNPLSFNPFTNVTSTANSVLSSSSGSKGADSATPAKKGGSEASQPATSTTDTASRTPVKETSKQKDVVEDLVKSSESKDTNRSVAGDSQLRGRKVMAATQG